MPRPSALESPFLSDELFAPEPPRVGGGISTGQATLHSPFLLLSAIEPEDSGWVDLAAERFDEDDEGIDLSALAQGEDATEVQDEAFVFDDEGPACAFEGAKTCTAAEEGEFGDEAANTVIPADEFDAETSLDFAPELAFDAESEGDFDIPTEVEEHEDETLEHSNAAENEWIDDPPPQKSP